MTQLVLYPPPSRRELSKKRVPSHYRKVTCEMVTDVWQHEKILKVLQNLLEACPSTPLLACSSIHSFNIY